MCSSDLLKNESVSFAAFVQVPLMTNFRAIKKDEELLYDAARSSIPEVFEFLPWCHPDYSEKDASDWLASIDSNWKSGSAYNFGIFDRDETEFHGGCGIGQIDEHPIGNLGYWVKTASTGQGIATEATIALAKFALGPIGLQRI